MEQIDKILCNTRNINRDFVIHIKNKDELCRLITVLEKHGFTIELNLFQESLREWMFRVAAENKYDTCFRVKNRVDDKCIAWNPSIEHWRLFCKDIIELENGKLTFIEKRYTLEAAEIEADKIILEIVGESPLKILYGDKTKKQIIDILTHG